MTECKDFNDLWDMDFKYNKTAPSLNYLNNFARRSQQKFPLCSADLQLNPGNFGFRSKVLRLSHLSGLPFELFMTSANITLGAQRTLS